MVSLNLKECLMLNRENKKLIKSMLPDWLLALITKAIPYRFRDPFKNLSNQEIFSKIYREGYWDSSGPKKYDSGSGSHQQHIVDVYLKAIEYFLASLNAKPKVVDLGCGNFSVGSKIRHLCDNYVACDIVQSVINWNTEQYCDLDVDFRILDITRDDLPPGDVVFVRQVFQHLSNDQIIQVIPKIVLKYKYLVLTEHLPASNDFLHNLDIPTGPDTRHSLPNGRSGVVLTSPPFNLKPIKTECLCEVSENEGILRTMLYQLH